MSLAKSAEYVAQGQPRPQGLLLVQNGGRRIRGVFCHVTHDEMAFSEVVSSVWWPCLFSAIGNRYSNKTKTFYRVCVTKFSEPLWQPWQGVSPTAILYEEKALGTRLAQGFRL